MEDKILTHLKMLELNLVLHDSSMNDLLEIVVNGRLLLKAYQQNSISDLETDVNDWIDSIYKYAIKHNLVIST